MNQKLIPLSLAKNPLEVGSLETDVAIEPLQISKRGAHRDDLERAEVLPRDQHGGTRRFAFDHVQRTVHGTSLIPKGQTLVADRLFNEIHLRADLGLRAHHEATNPHS